MKSILKALLTPLFLLPLVFIGYEAYVDWQLSRPLIRPTTIVEGELMLYQDPKDISSRTTYSQHQLAPPYLIVDFSCYPDRFELWNPHPKIRSVDGYTPSSNGFIASSWPIGTLYQDMYFDSLQLTFFSSFGDSLVVKERNLPSGKVCMNTQKLDRLAGYIRGDIPYQVDVDQEITIILESLGCFGGYTRMISWSPDRQLPLRYQEHSIDTFFSASYNFHEEAIGAIIQAQSTGVPIEEVGQTVVSIKVGPYVQQLFGDVNDLNSIRQLFTDVLESNNLETRYQ